MDSTLKDIEKGLKLLAEQRKREEEEERISFEEKAESIFQKIKSSKHFDILKTCFVSIFFAFFCYEIPNFYTHIIGEKNISVDFAELLQSCFFGGFRFFIARLIVDWTFYLNENQFYVFIKRNGNSNFDYQENLKKLNPWQQVKITSLKYIAYLFLFGYLCSI